MAEVKKLPIGEEFFKDIRTKNFYYVDKTDLITELLVHIDFIVWRAGQIADLVYVEEIQIQGRMEKVYIHMVALFLFVDGAFLYKRRIFFHTDNSSWNKNKDKTYNYFLRVSFAFWQTVSTL